MGEEVVKEEGVIVKLRCSHDPTTRDVMPERQPKVIHWVNAKDCIDAEVRLINPLFLPMPNEMPAGKDFMDYLNPNSWVICQAKAEKALTECEQEDRFQFERIGYFAPDYVCFEQPGKLVFNRVVPLKESSHLKQLEGKGQAEKTLRRQQQLRENACSKSHPRIILNWSEELLFPLTIRLASRHTTVLALS